MLRSSTLLTSKSGCHFFTRYFSLEFFMFMFLSTLTRVLFSNAPPDPGIAGLTKHETWTIPCVTFRVSLPSCVLLCVCPVPH